MEKEYLTYLALLGVLLAFGFYTPLFLVLQPLYKCVKWPGRHLIITNFALCCLLSFVKCSNLLLILITLELFWYGSKFLYLHNESEMYPPKEVLDYFKTHKGRILILNDEFPVNAVVPMGLVGITGYDPFILKSYHDLTNALQSIRGYGQVTNKLSHINKYFLRHLDIDYIYADKEFDGYEIVLKTQKAMLLRRKNG